MGAKARNERDRGGMKNPCNGDYSIQCHPNGNSFTRCSYYEKVGKDTQIICIILCNSAIKV